MPKTAKRRRAPDGSLNMTPMIDIVFQLIIFFVVTIKLDQDMINENIRLAMSPHGPPVADQKDPRTVIIEIDDRGGISIARRRLTPRQLQAVMQSAVNRAGWGIPVLIRADERSRHEHVRRVMDACSSVGLWRIQFAAVKKKVEDSK